jgi:hypothetical protein
MKKKFKDVAKGEKFWIGKQAFIREHHRKHGRFTNAIFVDCDTTTGNGTRIYFVPTSPAWTSPD